MWGQRQFSNVQRTLGSVALVVVMAAGTAGATTYAGNGASGFGGPVGLGSLTITDDGAGNINFSLATGGALNDDLVLYLDTQSGGANSNLTFTDNADGGRTAISGANNGMGTRSLVTFAPGFGADKAISVQSTFAGLFDLSTPSSFGYLGSGNIAQPVTGTFTFSYTRTQLGLGPKDPFSFEGTLISTSAFRSNETIGDSITVPPGDAGFSGTQTFLAANTFTAPVPLPAAAWGGLALIGLIGAGSLVRRFRVA